MAGTGLIDSWDAAVEVEILREYLEATFPPAPVPETDPVSPLPPRVDRHGVPRRGDLRALAPDEARDSSLCSSQDSSPSAMHQRLSGPPLGFACLDEVRKGLWVGGLSREISDCLGWRDAWLRRAHGMTTELPTSFPITRRSGIAESSSSSSSSSCVPGVPGVCGDDDERYVAHNGHGECEDGEVGGAVGEGDEEVIEKDFRSPRRRKKRRKRKRSDTSNTAVNSDPSIHVSGDYEHDLAGTLSHAEASAEPATQVLSVMMVSLVARLNNFPTRTGPRTLKMKYRQLIERCRSQ